VPLIVLVVLIVPFVLLGWLLLAEQLERSLDGTPGGPQTKQAATGALDASDG
jgi:hypothetical protein